ncbi:hypothetical protein [Paenibacillus sp. FSL L8-0638]|uniref:hypothetical protein n=1 Tax=Paenibacillus TaxID=44249 RepID=UPI003158C039
MKSVKLQNEDIPSIALDTWSWGTGQSGGDAVFGNYLTEADLEPVFEAAMVAGFNLWDTAAVYVEWVPQNRFWGGLPKTAKMY